MQRSANETSGVRAGRAVDRHAAGRRLARSRADEGGAGLSTRPRPPQARDAPGSTPVPDTAADRRAGEGRLSGSTGAATMSARCFVLALACVVASPAALAQAPTPDAPAVEATLATDPGTSTDGPQKSGNNDPPADERGTTAATTAATTEALPFFSLLGDRVGQGVGIETSLMWPVFPGSLFQLRAAVPIAFDGRGQLVVGAQGHAPHERREEGRFLSLAGQVGLRGYLWKGLHVDALTTVGVGRLEGSVVDGRTYNSVDVEVMALVGWRFEAGPVYVLLQPAGISSIVYRSNPWEIVGEGRQTSEPPIYIANIMLGAQF
jgi:hypothetical protein